MFRRERDFEERTERAGYGGRGRGEGRPEDGMQARQGRMIGDMVGADPERQVIFVGSVNCLRHKP